jgi:TonB family protein
VRKFALIAMAAISVSLSGMALSAGSDSPLQPVTPWDLDYAPAQCAAYRDYGDRAKPVTLMIRPSPNGETYEILVVRRSTGPEFAAELEGTVDFGSTPIQAWLLNYRAATKHLDVYQFRISANEMSLARSASSVRLHIHGAPDFAFTLASIPQLLDGLAACTADLKTYWNMGGEADGRIATSAKGDLRRLFTPNDYPTEALNRRQQGRAQFMLLVDQQGKVAGCHVLVASGAPVLDAMGCAVIQERAKFTPAFDRNHMPVRSTVVSPPVQWQIAA